MKLPISIFPCRCQPRTSREDIRPQRVQESTHLSFLRFHAIWPTNSYFFGSAVDAFFSSCCACANTSKASLLTRSRRPTRTVIRSPFRARVNRVFRPICGFSARNSCVLSHFVSVVIGVLPGERCCFSWLHAPQYW